MSRDTDSIPENTSDAIANRPLTDLRGAGPKLAEKLEKLGLHTVQDVLFHLPRQYEDRTRITPMGSLRPGERALVEGTVEHTEIVRRRRSSLLCRISDGSGFLTLRFLYFRASWKDNLPRGTRLRCFGEARPGYAGLEMVHPEYRRVAAGAPVAVDDRLTPVYPAVAGVTQKQLRSLADQALVLARRGGLTDWLPEAVTGQAGLTSLPAALEYVHHPPPDAPVAELAEGRHPAQQRLAFEELVAHQLSLRLLRARTRRHHAPALPAQNGPLRKAFLEGLGFQLTRAQQRVVREIGRDVGAEAPMMRLLQGDVGSGKTVVAAMAMLAAVEAGRQAVMVAPTELLAEQHFRTLDKWLSPLGVRLAWLTGRVTGKAREQALADIAGKAQVVIGTHALMEAGVAFRDLSLVVVDEQHRFGVHQRLSLRDKGREGRRMPHQMVMTATPIPRTLAMTAYADLDVSVIDELPPGRTPVRTVAASQQRRDEVVERVAAACVEGRQAYWVCPLIEESEQLQAQAATRTAEDLTERLPSVRVGLIHGRLKAGEKEKVMARFQAGELDLLVATTVIEVGVDVPNASLMIIDNAERLGLAQLHQLRGRVGRGHQESSCVLLYRPPLTDTARARLDVLRRSTDGFEIAREDLRLRGPGELLGTRQTGELRYRIADLERDHELLPRVHRAAEDMLAGHRDRVAPLIRRWVGERVRYRDV